MDQKLQCPECEYKFSFKGALFTHQLSAHIGRTLKCLEPDYLNVNYFTFRSLFDPKIDLRNHIGDIKVFDLIEIGGQLIDSIFDSFLKSSFEQV